MLSGIVQHISVIEDMFWKMCRNSQTKANTHTSGKKPIMFVTDDGASRGTMLYGISSPLKAASDLFIFLI